MAPVTNPPNVANPQDQGGGGGGGGIGNPGGVLATSFSLTPVWSNRGIFDYVSKNCFNHWKLMIAKLEEQINDCTSETF